MDIEECIDYCSNFVNVDQARSDLIRINEQRQQLLWFLANLINERETKKKGYSMPVRWQCLRPDLQVKYIDEAMRIVTEWWIDEESARTLREESDRKHTMHTVTGDASPAPPKEPPIDGGWRQEAVDEDRVEDDSAQPLD